MATCATEFGVRGVRGGLGWGSWSCRGLRAEGSGSGSRRASTTCLMAQYRQPRNQATRRPDYQQQRGLAMRKLRHDLASTEASTRSSALLRCQGRILFNPTGGNDPPLSRTWKRLFAAASRLQQQRDSPRSGSHPGAAPPSSHSPPPAALPPKKPLDALRAVTQHENIYTLPNFLTFTRLLAAPGLAYLLLHDQHVAAFALFVYAGVTDLLDGWIARRWNQQTVVGSVVDPMADKTLMMATTLALAAQARLPMPLAVVILGRDALLGVAALYYRYISLPPPKTMARYWDFSLPSAEVRPTGISKVNTALQLALIGATVGMPLVPAAVVSSWGLDWGLWGMQWVVGTTTVASGLSYVGSKDAVRILGKEEVERGQERALQGERKGEEGKRKAP